MNKPNHRAFVAYIAEALESRILLSTYYVGTTGNDASGTPTNPTTPWATIQKAATVVNPGDTVIVQPGVYYGPITLTRNGTAAAPITFKADSVAQNRVIITNANKQIREKTSTWTLVDAARQVYSIQWNSGVTYDANRPEHSFPARVLYDGVDLLPYKNLADLQNFTLTQEDGGLYPGVKHGFTYNPVTQTLYVRLHATKYGANTNPNTRLMAVSQHIGHGGKGVDTFDTADQQLYNFGITSGTSANVILDGFSFETPGVMAVYVKAHDVTVRNSWFRGVRAGVSGGTTQNDRNAPTSLFNSQNVIVEYNNYSQYPAYEDTIDVLNEWADEADAGGFFPEFWFQRKGQSASSANASIFQALDYETGGLTLRMGTNWTVRNNYVNDAFEGLSYLSMEHELGAPGQTGYATYTMSANIYNNVFDRVVDNAVETENHGQNIKIHHNEFIDVVQAISWQPLGGAPYPTDIDVYQNVAWLRPGTGELWRDKANTAVRWLKMGTQKNETIPTLPGDGLTMWNNTVIYPTGRFMQGLSSRESNVDFYNNIWITSDDPDGNALPSYKLPGFFFSHNLRASGAAGVTPDGDITGTGGVSVNGPAAAGLVDYANHQFELTASSPARHLGIAVPGRPLSQQSVEADGTIDAGAVAFGQTWVTPTTGPQTGATAPAAPSSLMATAVSTSQVNLAWTDNANNETSFKIDYSTSSTFASGVTTLTVNTPGTTTYSVASLAAETLYYFRVRASNAVGDSANSNTASVTTQSAPSVPAAPSGLTANAASASQVNLAWTDNATNETGFRVDYSTSSTFASGVTTLTIGSANANSYSVTGLAASTQYYFRVRANNATGESGNSNTASATTQATGSGGGTTLAFNAASDFTGNFAITYAGGTYSQVASGGNPGGYQNWNDPTGQSVTAVYDTTAGDRAITTHSRFGGGTTVETYSLDFRQSDYGDSIGITARLNDNGSAGYAAYMTNDSGDKRLRIAEVVGSYGRSLAAFVADVKVAGDNFPNPILPNTWYTLLMTVQNSGATVLVTAKILNASTGAVLFTTPTYTDTTAPAAVAGQVGIRLQGNSQNLANNINFDNYTILGTGTPSSPAAPSSLAAAAASASQVNLSWTDSASNETGFKIDYSTSSTFASGVTTITLGSANVTSHSVTGLSASTTYYFRVRASNGVGESGNSNTASAVTQSASGSSATVGFDSSSDFTSKFAITHPGGTYSHVATGGNPSGYQNWNDPTGQSVTAVYDTTPADRNAATHSKFGGGTTVETYSVDFRQSDMGDSIGVTARMNDSGSSGYAAYMTMDSGDKRLRIAEVTGNHGRSLGAFVADVQIGGDGFPNPILPNTWYTLQMTVQNVGSSVVVIARILNATTGAVLFTTASYTDTTSPAFAAGQAGIRLQGNGQNLSNNINFDNYKINVP